jgi:hypothetical protein
MSDSGIEKPSLMQQAAAETMEMFEELGFSPADAARNPVTGAFFAKLMNLKLSKLDGTYGKEEE